jgi:hypothetical protein
MLAQFRNAGASFLNRESLVEIYFAAQHFGISFWDKPKADHHPHVLPVRPEVIPGRISHQSSCFTMHMHRAQPVNNDSLIAISVEAKKKNRLRDELHRMNINQFTIYSDLDHLSKEITRSWGLP